MKLSTDQRNRILILLGRIESRRRRIDLWKMTRTEADTLIRQLTLEDDHRAHSNRGRPRTPRKDTTR